MASTALTKVTNTRKREILGVDGKPLTRESLFADVRPNDPSLRMTARRKGNVVTAIRNGIITAEEAAKAYVGYSAEEWSRNAKLLHDHGVDGLKVTHVQEFRS